jgi:hypothetical protein
LNRGNARKLGAIRQRPGNAGSHRSAWWARQDSNLEPDRYGRYATDLKVFVTLGTTRTRGTTGPPRSNTLSTPLSTPLSTLSLLERADGPRRCGPLLVKISVTRSAKCFASPPLRASPRLDSTSWPRRGGSVATEHGRWLRRSSDPPTTDRDREDEVVMATGTRSICRPARI